MCTLIHPCLYLTVFTSPKELLHNDDGKLSNSLVNGSEPDRALKANFTLS